MTSHKISGVLVAAICAAGLLAGCEKPKIVRTDTVDLVEAHYDATDCLLKTAGRELKPTDRILTASFVELDDTTRSSTFGRLAGEVCASRLNQRGYSVVNVKLRRKSIAIVPRSGEFLLSRDVKELGEDYNAQVVLVGTYLRTQVSEPARAISTFIKAVDPAEADSEDLPRVVVLTPDYVYVSLRLIRVEDNELIAAYDFRVLCDQGAESLLTEATVSEEVAWPQ